jgi:hypothetical protein
MRRNKIERYHLTVKGEINQVLYGMPGELKKTIRVYIEYYKYRRYQDDGVLMVI